MEWQQETEAEVGRPAVHPGGTVLEGDRCVWGGRVLNSQLQSGTVNGRCLSPKRTAAPGISEQ